MAGPSQNTRLSDAHAGRQAPRPCAAGRAWHCAPRSAPWRARFGFTLLESLVAAAVLGAAVVGVAAPLLASHQQSQAAQQTGMAIAIARQLLEEIAARPFAEPDGSTHLGPESGETTRAAYDNADDYHAYEDSTPALKSIDGSTLIVAGETYKRSVSVQYRSGRSGPTANTGDYALVTVSVLEPCGRVVRLARLITRVKYTW